jgi:MarR family transcriptional regulator, organic hydroperoxide resistance regulator
MTKVRRRRTGTRVPAGDSDAERILRHWRDRVPDDRLAHLVKDAVRMLDRVLQRRLARHRVSSGHWPFLRALWATDGLTQIELSREAGVMEPTTFAALKAMESLGYIVRRPVSGDRRKKQVFLTARGRALERRLVPLATKINAIAIDGVAEGDVAATRRTLLAMIDNLAADEAQADDGRHRIPSTRELGRRVGEAASAPGRARH